MVELKYKKEKTESTVDSDLVFANRVFVRGRLATFLSKQYYEEYNENN